MPASNSFAVSVEIELNLLQLAGLSETVAVVTAPKIYRERGKRKRREE